MMVATAQFNTASRIDALAESQTLAMASRVRALKAQGKDIISLTLGEPDFDTPEHIRQAAIDAIQANKTHYPPVAGIPELRAAVAEHFRAEYGMDYSREQILISTGAKQSLLNVIMSLVNPGDEVLIPAPYWVSYIPMTQMAEGVPVILPTDSSFKLSPDALASKISPRTKLLLMNSPSNPSGAMYSREEIEALASVLERFPQVMVLSDEIYALIRYTPSYQSWGAVERLRERVIVVNGVSKAFAMTGWRIGFTAGPQWVINACEKFQGQITSGANSIAQWAAVTAVSQSLAPTDEMVNVFRKRRDFGLDLFAKLLPECKINIPDGAFYFMPDISAYFGRRAPLGNVIMNADDVAEYLLDAVGVAVVSGTGFGTQNHIRLSYACSIEDIDAALNRMQVALSRLG